MDQLGHDILLVEGDTELSAKVKGRAVEIHRSQKSALAVGNKELCMDTEFFLFVDLCPSTVHDAQRGECVEDVALANAVASPTENVHFDPARRGLHDTVQHSRIDKFRVLHEEGFLGGVDESGHGQAGTFVAPDEAGIR